MIWGMIWDDLGDLRHGLLSVGGRLLVLRVRHGEEVLELPLQGLKGRSLHWVLEKLDKDNMQGGKVGLRHVQGGKSWLKPYASTPA